MPRVSVGIMPRRDDLSQICRPPLAWKREPLGRGATLIGLVLITLAGCGGSAEAPPTPTAPTTPTTPTTVSGAAASPTPGEAAPAAPENDEPPVAEAPTESPAALITGACVVDDPLTLGESGARRVSARLAFGPEGGLVAFTQDDEHISVHTLDASGTPNMDASTVDLTNARDLYGLYRLESFYLIASHAVCPGGRRMNKCLALRALKQNGSAAGPEHVETTREWMANPQFRVDGDSLIVLRGHLYIPSVLERYVVAADGGITRESLTELAFDRDYEPPAPLGLAVDGAR